MYIKAPPMVSGKSGVNPTFSATLAAIMTVPYPYSTHCDDQAVNLCDLPRELVYDILGYLPTQFLATIASTSRLFYCIISFLVRSRVNSTLSRENFNLIYECHVPSHRYGAPYNHCTLLGTSENLDAFCGSSPSKIQEKLRYHSQQQQQQQQQQQKATPGSLPGLPALGRLYTHFLPLPPENSPTGKKFASTDVTLESFELFTQVCSQASLVKFGPRRGLFESVVPIFESFFRVRRKWLDESVDRAGARKSASAFAAAAAAASEGTITEEPGTIIWVGLGENVGLRLKVGNRRKRGYPLLGEEDEDVPATYKVEYQELIIRTGYILSKIESCREEKRDMSNAIMFAF